MVSIGQTVADLQSVAAAAYLTIQPTGSEEWTINTIYHDGSVELYRVSGVGECKVDADGGYGWWGKCGIKVTNTQYIRVKNVEIAAFKIGYDGTRTY